MSGHPVSVTTDRTIDASSLESIVRQVVERAGATTNDEKAVALFEYLHNTIFHGETPREAPPRKVGPLKVIHVYGFALCGGQHTVLKALFETAGWEVRYVGWSDPGHTTIEVRYDGTWHYLDVFLKCYFWSKDRSHIVSQEEIAADPSLVLDAVKEGRAARQHLCCGDSPGAVVSGCKSRNVVGDLKGWGSISSRDDDYSPTPRLPSGAALRLGWFSEPGAFAVSGKAPQHSCRMRDILGDKVLGPVAEHYGTRNWSNGRVTYAPEFRNAADMSHVQLVNAAVQDGRIIATGEGASATFKLPLPYAYVGARVEANFEKGEGRLLVSSDGGKTWKPGLVGDISAQVKQTYEVWVKVDVRAELSKFRLEGVVEHNRGALPHLLAGKNQVTVSSGPDWPAEVRASRIVTVTYTFQEASVANPAQRTRWDGKGIDYGPVRTATKEITQFPCTFEIEVGGNLPPKMLSLERSVQGK